MEQNTKLGKREQKILDLKVDIGATIAKGLEKKKWSKRKFAEMMGVSAPIAHNWINNNAMPRGDTIIKIALVLDIIQELFPCENLEKVDLHEFKNDIKELKNKIEEIELKMKSVLNKADSATK